MAGNLKLLGLADAAEMRQKVINVRGGAHETRRHFLSIYDKGASVTNK